MDRLKGTALMMLSATGFGVMVLFSRTASEEGVDPASLLFMRLGIAALVLLTMAWRRQVAWPTGRSVWVAAAMGAIFCVNALAYFLALNEGAAASVAAVFFCYPVFVALLGCLISRRLMDARSALCTALAVLGCWLTVVPAKGEAASLPGPALALALSSAALYAVYVLLSRSLSTRSDPLAQAGVITASSAVCLGLIVAAQGLNHPVSWLGWACVVALALFSTVVSITAFLAGARILGTTRAAALSAAEPVVTALTAWVAFGEALSPLAWLGMALVVGSVVISTLAPQPAPSSSAAIQG
ncbi:DMT family transporter [Aquabacterium sp.]|uniref:DMT family transporter n=1 Tax=Aquabacterium sp. TaxID=1872578 RepID=UPI0025BFCFE6|nr:DMT family transporter [Aquabacterium sp.]